MKMSMGMNTNVKYKGRVYHIQTEDGGENRPIITSLLFKDGGVVVSSKRTDYADLLQGDSYREDVAALMKEQHKTMIRTLVRGEIEGIDTIEKEMSPAEDSPQIALEKDAPVIDAEEADRLIRSGEKKDLDTLILEYLAKKDSDVA